MPFLDALSFLTRLIPARATIDDRSISASVAWFGPAGLVLGLFCTALAWSVARLLATDGASPLPPALGGLAWLAGEIWATRGLHWDGLADLADAAGSFATGEHFQQILRDSRLGASGALALFIVLMSQWLTICGHIARANWPELTLAAAWGRAGAVWLAAEAQPHAASNLGRLACAGASRKLSHLYILLAAATVFLLMLWSDLPIARCGLLFLLQWLLVRSLCGLARRQGGISGDYLGCGIELSQACFLLVTLN